MRGTILLPILLASAGFLPAQEGRSWVEVQAGHFGQRDSWTRNRQSDLLQGSTGVGAGAGTWLTDEWGLGISVLGSVVRLAHAPIKGHEYHALASVLYNLYPNYVWAPYLEAGAGATRLDPVLGGTARRSVVPNGFLGAGFQFYPYEWVQVGFDARLVRIQARTASGGYRREEGQMMLSVGYRWRR